MSGKIAIVMGSRSDWPVMQEAAAILDDLKLPYEASIVSAHRSPDRLSRFARQAQDNGFSVIIAGAGGAAHLPGMVAAQTLVPVLGVPIDATVLKGIDALLSIVQMPAGTPVATMAVGIPGARNAAWFAAQLLAAQQPDLMKTLQDIRQHKEDQIEANPDPREPLP